MTFAHPISAAVHVSNDWSMTLKDLSDHLDALVASNAEAFELSESGKLRQLLQKLEQQHAQYKFELNALLRVSSDADTFLKNTRKLQHSWLNVRDTFTDKRAEDDLVKECLRGELITLNHYDKALSDELPSNIHEPLLRQRRGILLAAERLSVWTSC